MVLVVVEVGQLDEDVLFYFVDIFGNHPQIVELFVWLRGVKSLAKSMKSSLRTLICRVMNGMKDVL